MEAVGGWPSASRCGETARPRHPVAGAQVVAVGAVTVANGGDNIAVYTPLLATSSAVEMALLVLVFSAMTTLWLLAAHGLVGHPTLGPPIRVGRYALPFLLIGLGILILAEADTLGLIG